MTKKKESSDQSSNDSNANLSQFFGETKEELEKVVWPSRQQLLSESTAVLLMVILVAAVIYLVDNFFSWGSGKVF
ncbi:MAG: preprotein translocase subunit SecE [Xenococcus sp. (in: cyanobacteria)]